MKSVHVDGFIYVTIAFFGAWSSALGTDEAAKYLPDVTLFWARSICASLAASALALKMYRSTAFSDYKKEKNGTNPPFVKP